MEAGLQILMFRDFLERAEDCWSVLRKAAGLTLYTRWSSAPHALAWTTWVGQWLPTRQKAFKTLRLFLSFKVLYCIFAHII